MGIIVGIDATRSRSGGGKAHLIGILNNSIPSEQGITLIHVWAFKSVLEAIPNFPWLIKHCPKETEKSILFQLLWQFWKLPKEARKLNCDVMLNTDAGTVCTFKPSVVMSRDMLSFEKKEIGRYGIGKDWLRLFILRSVQSKSLKKADGAIFLTNYAAKTIQQWTGIIKRYKVIPHGVGKQFKVSAKGIKEIINKDEQLNCIYVSNTARYKHQWHVLKAIYLLRQKGFNIHIKFVGGGLGYAQEKLDNAFKLFDADRKYAVQLAFVDHEKLPELITASDIFIFASSCENMPNTLVEGMACGMPIACSNLGPMPEVLQDGGVYFNPEVPDEIVNAIEKIIIDNKLRLNIASKANMLSEQYSWKRCAEETWNYLVEISKIKSK
jgi:glycosyltransferase involved in cell wall biosynthesis